MVRAVDPRLGRDAYGAELIVSAGGRRFCQLVNPASSYLASNDVRAHFGLGETEHYDEIAVHWPDGLREVFPPGQTDRFVVLQRGEGRLVKKGDP